MPKTFSDITWRHTGPRWTELTYRTRRNAFIDYAENILFPRTDWPVAVDWMSVISWQLELFGRRNSHLFVSWGITTEERILNFIGQIIHNKRIFQGEFHLLHPDLLEQCLSTAGARPGTGSWHQLYRAARGSSGICHFSFLSKFHEQIFYSGNILRRKIFVNVSKNSDADVGLKKVQYATRFH